MAFGIPILFKFEELWSGGIISCSGLVLGFMVKEYMHYSCIVLFLCCLLLLFCIVSSIIFKNYAR
jgi:hypothetical protein